MPSHKEVVLAIMGAATGLAGLVLVFLGILVSAFESYDREGKDAARPKFAPTAWLSVAAFVLGLFAVVLAIAWLLRPSGNALYFLAIVAFLADVTLIGYVAVSVVRGEFRTG
jgi:antibiotic biosynthesis monooxygenase (ABM) superfamily enzyme